MIEQGEVVWCGPRGAAAIQADYDSLFHGLGDDLASNTARAWQDAEGCASAYYIGVPEDTLVDWARELALRRGWRLRSSDLDGLDWTALLAPSYKAQLKTYQRRYMFVGSAPIRHTRVGFMRWGAQWGSL